MDTQNNQFEGFSEETLDFLKNVREKNSKTWYQKNKERYRKDLLEPFQDLVMALSGAMLTIDPYFEIRPLVTKTISRIYRDTRFSKDKSLFKRNMWITFKRPIKEWRDAPAYFFELSPDSYRYGMGYYSASRTSMDRLRGSIDKNPKEFQKVVSFFENQNRFKLEGDRYKRFINNENPEEIQDWYQRKSFYLVCNNTIDQVLFSSALVDVLLKNYFVLKPLYQYLINL